MRKLVIGDFGCGEAELSSLLLDNKVHSFDHHNVLNEKVITPCNMKHTPLLDGELDVAVFSLSFMSTDWFDYITEAKRVLTDKGHLMIAETTRSLSPHGSLFGDEGEGRLYRLKEFLQQEGFEVYVEEQRGRFTLIDCIKH